MTAILNQIAEKWFSWQLSMFWQVGLLIIIIAGLDLLIKKWAWPQVRYALWLLILVKLVLPPTLTSPMSFTAEIPFMVKQAAIKISQPQTSPHAIKPVIVPVIEPIPADTTTQPVEIIPASYTAPATPAGAFLSGKTYVLFVWLAGVGILSGWLIIRLSNLRHQHLKDKQSNLPERLEDLLVSTARKLGLKKTPQVILTNKVCCPAVFGIFRPVLLIPADKLQNMTSQDAEHIFLHELAHIKRGDLLVHAVYMILQIAYWFNPLLWLIRKNLQNLRELCCDATVARLLREKTVGYRQTLLETARQLLAEPVDPGLGLLGLFENSSWLVDRLRWLEKKSWRYRPLRITTIFVLVCLMTACVLPMTKFEAPVDLVIKGIVTDLQTGEPIAGVKVFDDGYGPAPEWSKIRPDQRAEWGAITNSKGEYSFLTWPEHHSIKAETPGFKSERKSLYSGHFTLNKKDEEIFDFALEPEKSSSEATVSIKEIMELAEEKARSLNHEYIGTEHILLVIAEEKGVASKILSESGIDEDKLIAELLKVIKKGPKPVTKKTLPITPRAQQTIDYAVQQAGSEDNLNTGHILLGLMQVEDGVAAQVLKSLGLEKEKVINFALEPEKETGEQENSRAGEDSQKSAGQSEDKTGEAENKVVPSADETTKLAQIKNMMATLGGTFDAANIAAFASTRVREPNTTSAAKIMEEALPQFEKFELAVEGMNYSKSVHLIIEQIRQIIRANEDGDSVRVKALISASGNSWNRLEQIVGNDYNLKIVEEAGKMRSELQNLAGQRESRGETNDVSEKSAAKDIKTARTLKITIYEGNDVEPQTNVRIPLIAMKIVRQLLPSKDKLQIIAQKIKLDENLPQDMNSQDLIEMLDEMLTKLDEGFPSTTLLEVKDGDERIIIALE